MKPRAALPNRLITLFLLLAIVFSTSHAAWAQDSAASVEAANTAASADAAATLPANSADAAQPSAFKRFESTIDGAAGRLVGYLAAVIFYDVVFWDNPTADSPPDAPNVVVPLAVLWLILGAVFFTLKMQFINFRGFFHAIEVTMGKFDKPGAEGEVSHFQALTAALSATVGLGNIAGVAIAVSAGGPGATFWMIVAGLLGMTSKFAECTLGQRYRQIRPDGRVMGGAMYYLSNGLTEIGLRPLGTVLALLFTVLCIGGSFGGGCAFQVNQSLGAVRQTFPALAGHEWVYGLIMTGLVGIVIIGGIRRIAAIAEKIVPLMCGVYVAACFFILLKNAALLPNAITEIVSGAFTPEAGYGGFLGVLIQGFRRAAFSNEAGVGSAAIAHSAAKTRYPVREGIVALLEPFIDTVVVCSMTALVIVITG
ncbi:MAG: amino acid carrier protein, partial [Planctomycetales bacterium]|nr:amino acid carrier protein [Planctomycetales bacterium]